MTRVHSGGDVVRLSFRDLAVVLSFLVIHGAAVTGMAWRYTNAVEARLTKLETNQSVNIMTMEGVVNELKAQHVNQDRLMEMQRQIGRIEENVK